MRYGRTDFWRGTVLPRQDHAKPVRTTKAQEDTGFVTVRAGMTVTGSDTSLFQSARFLRNLYENAIPDEELRRYIE